MDQRLKIQYSVCWKSITNTIKIYRKAAKLYLLPIVKSACNQLIYVEFITLYQ
jgi:hypothetical protein